MKHVTEKNQLEGLVTGEKRSPTEKHHFLQCTHQLFVKLYSGKRNWQGGQKGMVSK